MVREWLRYDIFEKWPDGTMHWIDVVDSLTEAKSRLGKLAQGSVNEYRVYDLFTREVIMQGPLLEASTRQSTSK